MPQVFLFKRDNLALCLDRVLSCLDEPLESYLVFPLSECLAQKPSSGWLSYCSVIASRKTSSTIIDRASHDCINRE